MFKLSFLLQIFLPISFYLQDFIKIVRLLLAAVSINELNVHLNFGTIPIPTALNADRWSMNYAMNNLGIWLTRFLQLVNQFNFATPVGFSYSHTIKAYVSTESSI